MVGALGTDAGVTALEATEDALVPTALVAMTVKVYATPLTRLVTVAVKVDPFGVVAVRPWGSEVTV
jgi:hypothetical protein